MKRIISKVSLFFLIVSGSLLCQQEPVFKNGCYYNDDCDNRHHLFDGPKILFEAFKKTFSYGKCDEKVWHEQQPVELSSEDPRITWIGHASFLIQIGGCNILTDPVFWNVLPYLRKSPVGIPPQNLPKIDYVLISHNHRDHMDTASLKWLQKNHHPVFLIPQRTVLPLNLSQDDKVYEKTWWEKIEFNGITFTFLPANHWSGTGLFDGRKALWGSWMIENKNHAIYFAGDSARGDHFNSIKSQFPSIDVALMPIAPECPYDITQFSHMDTRDSVEAFKVLGAKSFIPMHWGTFFLGADSFEAPIDNLQKVWDESGIDEEKQLAILKFGGVWEKQHVNG